MNKSFSIYSKTPLVTICIIFPVWTSWFIFIGPTDAVGIVADNWPVSLTMAFGSIIAGATSEGGGAVAFPIFTKILQVAPEESKVFSLAIQSVGMTAASTMIIAMRIQVEWRVIRWVSLGGIIGMLLGTVLLAPLLPPAAIKMSFTVMATSFAVTLFAMNHGIHLYNLNLSRYTVYEKSLMLIIGIVGGTMCGLVGNGIDIIAFSLMVLLFRISEKIATPTSVILMSINAIFGFFIHYFVIGGFNDKVEEYWLAAIPVVVVGAPLGAIICSTMSRRQIVNLLLLLILIEFVSSILLIRITKNIFFISLAIFVVFTLFNVWMMSNKTYESYAVNYQLPLK